MITIPKGKIPKQIKVEVTLDIDRDVYVEKLCEGWEMNRYIESALKRISCESSIVADISELSVIKEFIFED